MTSAYMLPTLYPTYTAVMSSANYRQYLKEIWYNPNNPTKYVGSDKSYCIAMKDGKYKIRRTRFKQWLQLKTRIDHHETS